MKNLNVVVYTMEGCPFCVEFKEILTKESTSRAIIQVSRYIIAFPVCRDEFFPVDFEYTGSCHVWRLVGVP